MTEELLRQLEDLIGTDEFEYRSEEIMEQLEDEGVGIEITESLLSIMERHPLDDYGMPGAMTHFIERFYPDFLPSLIASVKRRPAAHTVWMLQRCINAASDKEELIAVLRDVADDSSVEQIIRDEANSFLKR